MTSETFNVIQTLCRVGLGADNPAFRRQVERLRDVVAHSGAKTEAATLERLLNAAARSAGMQPSKVTVSPAFAGAETLTSQTALPVDRETGAALAEVIFPAESPPEFPLLNAKLEQATLSVVEEWRQQEKLRAAGVMPPVACLLYGPPGTGKTRIALVMAARLGLPVVLARLDGVISSFLGTTGRNVANLFGFANRYNCVLLLDEFDAIAKVRDDPHEIGEIKRVVNAILQNIDSRKTRGITIAITNHEQLLDSAVWRRFDVRIAIPPPAFAERVRITERYFDSEEITGAAARFIAWLSEGMTGADIEVMSKIVRRHRALRPDSSLLNSLRHYSTTQAGCTNARHLTALGLEPVVLAREMNASAELSLTQKDIGTILGTSQTQIGRWLKEPSVAA